MSTQVDSRFVDFLHTARSLLLFTGAGISTNSGIRDFRGPQGVWKQYQPVYYQDFMNSEEARIRHWEYKLNGWESFRIAEPNDVHKAIVDLENDRRICAVVTQNIDGLHAKAGTARSLLVELHGNNLEIECQSCLKRSGPGPHYEHFKKTRLPPECECGGFLKPATISFGQNLRDNDMQRAVTAAQNADLVIALGTSLSVYPAASLTLLAAHRGVPYVIINKGVTDHDGESAVSLRLEGDVSDIFPPAVQTALSGI